jgi:hypothetical protein
VWASRIFSAVKPSSTPPAGPTSPPHFDSNPSSRAVSQRSTSRGPPKLGLTLSDKVGQGEEQGNGSGGTRRQEGGPGKAHSPDRRRHSTRARPPRIGHEAQKVVCRYTAVEVLQEALLLRTHPSHRPGSAPGPPGWALLDLAGKEVGKVSSVWGEPGGECPRRGQEHCGRYENARSGPCHHTRKGRNRQVSGQIRGLKNAGPRGQNGCCSTLSGGCSTTDFLSPRPGLW